MQSHRATRADIAELKELLQVLIEIEKKNGDHLEYLTLKEKASEMVNSDSALVGIPWGTVEDMWLGIETVEQQQAIKRLLMTSIVSATDVHYMANVHAALFKEHFRGRLCLGTLQNWPKHQRVIFWGKEFYPFPRELSEIMIVVVQKRFDLSPNDARDKVQTGINEARLRQRCRLRVS